MNISKNLRFSLIAVLVTGFSTLAHAQATRTWVSGVGDDVNPCSRTAPCKTFAGAISKTANCGEISVLDPGGFGTVTITKSMTLNGTGTLASILAAGTNGINVNDSATGTPNTIVVVVRDISINGACTGFDGIRFTSGSALTVDHCWIHAFRGNGTNSDGIDVAKTSGDGHLKVLDAVIENNTGDGIAVTTGSGQLRAMINGSRMMNCANGLQAKANSRVVARNCVFSNNTGNGIFVNVPTAGLFAAVSVWESVMSLNTFQGVQAGNGGNTGSSGVTLSLNQIDRNGASGVFISGGGVVGTFSNNSINGNATDGCGGCTPVGPGS